MISAKQRAAMHAAAAGKSTIGIPKKVGRKFVAEDKGDTVESVSSMSDRSFVKAFGRITKPSPTGKR
jgi:hypothetical protein